MGRRGYPPEFRRGVRVDMKTLFMDATPATQHRILQALFEHVEVLGPNEVWLYPSVEAEARGWAAAMSGEFRVEMRKTGRGERGSPFLTQQRPPFRMINATLRDSVVSAEGRSA